MELTLFEGLLNLLVGSALAALGIWGIRRSVADRKLGHASLTWPTVEGEITELAVGCSRKPGTLLHRRRTTYWPVVRYMYPHGAEWLTGEQLAYSGPFPDGRKEAAEDVLARYAHRKKVRVSVSPENPTVTVLEPGPWEWTPTILVIAVFFIVVGAGLILSVAVAIAQNGS